LDASAVDGAESLVIVALIRGGGGGDKSRARVDLPRQVRVSLSAGPLCPVHITHRRWSTAFAGRAGQWVDVGWVLASECLEVIGATILHQKPFMVKVKEATCSFFYRATLCCSTVLAVDRCILSSVRDTRVYCIQTIVRILKTFSPR